MPSRSGWSESSRTSSANVSARLSCMDGAADTMMRSTTTAFLHRCDSLYPKREPPTARAHGRGAEVYWPWAEGDPNLNQPRRELLLTRPRSWSLKSSVLTARSASTAGRSMTARIAGRA